MTFGEKLFKLRKEKGLSQEALAEQLNTTRQAISKWENGQGYPETEKLLLLGNIFEVSIDYLLKDTVVLNKESEDGYYVSREMAEGFLLSSRKLAKHIGLGFFFIALAFIPYFLFKDDPTMYTILVIVIATIGVGMFVSGAILEEDRYKFLKQERLIFDEKFLKELIARYESLKKRYAVIMIIGVCSLVAGGIPFLLEKKVLESGTLTIYHPYGVALIAIGLYIIVRTSAILEAYKLLAHNEHYTSKLSFKLKRKFREKIDEF